MALLHEIVPHKPSHPVNIIISGAKNVQKHWHSSLEILLVLEGEANLQISGQEIALLQDDVYVVHSNTVHSLFTSNENNVILTLQLSSSFLREAKIDTSKQEFVCCSKDGSFPEVFSEIRTLLANIGLLELQETQKDMLLVKSYLYRLMFLLSTYFMQKRVLHNGQNASQNLERITGAIEEIQTKYNTNLTLESVAKVQNLSKNHFAYFFKKHMETTFLEYLNNVRLEHAYERLLASNLTATEIALENGFPNTKSFTRSFKQVFNQTPSAYRTEYRKKQVSEKVLIPTISYFEIEGSRKYKRLYHYIETAKLKNPLPKATHNIQKKIDTNIPGKKIKKNPCSLVTIGRASSILKADVQSQLAGAQQDIGFEYIRFHGVLDDDMGFYREDADGNPIYNFHFVDNLMDFLLSVNLKPMLELAFMPSALAATNNSIWNGLSTISMPKDIKKWEALIKELICHFIARYGLQAVCSWKFEIWNEPEYSGVMWQDSAEDFFKLWNSTCKTIKSIDKKLQVGGPSILLGTLWMGDWFASFVRNCELHSTMPDFLTVHFYPVDGIDYTVLESVDASAFEYENFSGNWPELNKAANITLSSNPESLRQNSEKMRDALQKYGWDTLAIYLTEWNSTMWQRDLLADSTYKSAFLVKNILDNLDNFDGFGYWTLSDCMEELPLAPELFHGGFGLITAAGIPKAGYYGLALFAGLGPQLLCQENNFSVFKNGSDIQILLHHYCHPDQNYLNFDMSAINKHERTGVFGYTKNILLQLSLLLKAPGKFRIKETIISASNGSSFDAWLEMGAPEQMTKQELQNLAAHSVPMAKISTTEAQTELSLEYHLCPNEVMLVEISPLP